MRWTRNCSARSLPAPSASGRAAGKRICPAAALAGKGALPLTLLRQDYPAALEGGGL